MGKNCSPNAHKQKSARHQSGCQEMKHTKSQMSCSIVSQFGNQSESLLFGSHCSVFVRGYINQHLKRVSRTPRDPNHVWGACDSFAPAGVDPESRGPLFPGMGCPQSWNVKKLDLDHMSPSRKITFLHSRVSFVCSKVGHLASYNLTFQKRGICLVNSISHIWATNQIQVIRYPLEDGL